MAKTSCLIHAPNSRLAIVRGDYLKVCENNLSAAILLSLIEHATNFQLELIERVKTENEAREKEQLPPKKVDLWIYRKRDEWIADSMGLLKLHDYKTGMAYLEQRKFIERRRHPEYKWTPTRQVKLDFEAVNKATGELFGLSISPTPAVTDNRTSSNGQPHVEEPAPAQYKESTDSIQTHVQTLAAPPLCGKCGKSATASTSNGHAFLWCKKCNIPVGEYSPDSKSDAAICLAYYKRLFSEAFGIEPYVTAGKDYGIIERLVKQYGKPKVEELLRGYLKSGDERVVAAGYNIAFFSARVSSLIVAGRGVPIKAERKAVIPG